MELTFLVHLNKQLFVFWGSLVVPWFVLGLLFGIGREGTTEGNLNKSAF